MEHIGLLNDQNFLPSLPHFFLWFFLFYLVGKDFLRDLNHCKATAYVMLFSFSYPNRFVLICNKLAVGAIIAVPVTRAFRVDSEHTTDAIVHCSSTPVPVKLGVSRIWVHRDHRRKVQKFNFVVFFVTCFCV